MEFGIRIETRYESVRTGLPETLVSQATTRYREALTALKAEAASPEAHTEADRSYDEYCKARRADPLFVVNTVVINNKYRLALPPVRYQLL